MQARGPLMIEHRLIERMIAVIKKEVEKIRAAREVDPVFIDTAVDFIRIYADRTHHGKEEEICFRELSLKDMTGDDQAVMKELVDEHVIGRQTVRDLLEAKRRYLDGDKTALQTIIDKFSFLVDFYPRHIAKEDKVFFPRANKYFTEKEQATMLAEFWEFDRRMIHYKYITLVEELEK